MAGPTFRPEREVIYTILNAALDNAESATLAKVLMRLSDFHRDWGAAMSAPAAKAYLAMLAELSLAPPPEPEPEGDVEPAAPAARATPAGPRSRAGNWFFTRRAVEGMMHILNFRDSEESYQRALERLKEVATTANYKRTDLQGRELWASPGNSRVRLVVSYSKRPEGPLPQVIWAGQGRPKEVHWSEPPEPGT